MAELIAAEGARFAVQAEGSLVGRRSDDGSHRPDIDLADLAGGRTVSRRHARILLANGEWRVVVEPNVTNDTAVGGQPLAAGQSASLDDGAEVKLGKITLTFRADLAAPKAGSIQALAELRAERRSFALDAPEGRELTLGRHSDDRAYQPDIDLGDLVDGRTVSRRHGHLHNEGGRWFLTVEAAVTNPTVLEGRTLALGEVVPLEDGNKLQLGRVIVTFHQLRSIASVAEEQIELIVEPVAAAVEAGGEAEATVTIINHTGHVDWFRVELEGIPQSWYRIVLPDGTVGAPAQVRLFHTPAHTAPAADAVAKLKIVYAPPRSPEARAGVHPLVVSATTQGEPQVRRATTGQLTIAPFAALQVTVAPEEISKPRGDFQVALYNGGNDVAAVTVQPDGDWVVYQWDRPAIGGTPVEKQASKLSEIRAEPIAQVVPVFGKIPDATVAVTPAVAVKMINGARDSLKLTVKPKRRHWFGSDRVMSFAVVTKAGQDEIRSRAALVCPPRIPIWIQTAYRRVQSFLLPFIVLIGILALLFAFGRPADIKDFKAEPASAIVGTPVNLTWSLDRATGVTIEPSSGNEQLTVPEGSLAVSPPQTTRYTLIATNRLGLQTTRSVSVEVKPAPKLPSILTFSASPERIKKEGEAITLRWETDGATKVVIEPSDEIKDPPASGEATIRPLKSAAYKLIVTNAAGSKEATKNIVIEPPQIASFAASAETVAAGGEVKLRWTAQGFTKLTLKASAGELMPEKQEIDLPLNATEQAVRPLEDTEYTLTATNAGGTETKTAKVTVTAMKVGAFRAEPATVAKGEAAMLTWSVEGATAVTIEPEVGAVAKGQNSAIVKPAQTTEYTLTATGADGKKSQAKATITVGDGPVKVDFFTAAPTAIAKGESAILTFSVQNAKRVLIKGSDGKVVRDAAVSQPSLKESVTVAPDKTTTYTLTASNDAGETALPATVEVKAPTPTPPPAPPAPPAQPSP